MKASYFLIFTPFFVSPIYAETFVYDDADRLVSEIDGRTVTYTTDDVGNVSDVIISNLAPLAPSFAAPLVLTAATPKSAAATPSVRISALATHPTLAIPARKSLKRSRQEALETVEGSDAFVAEVLETAPLNAASGFPEFWKMQLLGGAAAASIAIVHTAEGRFAASLSRITLAPAYGAEGISLELSHLDYLLLGEPLIEWAPSDGPWIPLDWEDDSAGVKTELPRLSAPAEFYLRIR